MGLTQPLRSDDDGEVMAAIDPSGERALFLISDISKDDAWINVSQTEAVTLDSWR